MPRKRILSLLICLVLLIQLLPQYCLAASNVPESPVVATIDSATPPVTGHNQPNGYYADISWNKLTAPNDVNKWDGVKYNVYVQMIDRNGIPGAYSKKSYIDYSVANSGVISARLEKLPEHGTIYNVYVTAYYYRIDDNGIETDSGESEKSNILSIMTDIEISASPYGTKQIEIEWDDVWLAGSRISYDLYISDEKIFDENTVKAITITSSQIGSDGKVKVDQASGKLKYIHTVTDAGRVYYVKIVPRLEKSNIVHNSESATVATSSFILATTTKLYDSDQGEVWRLDWSQVAVSFANLKVSYLIYKQDVNSSNLAQYLFSVSENTAQLIVPPEDKDDYYIIYAKVTENGEDYYDVDIRSDNIYLKDSDTPAKPAAPEIVEQITGIGSYSDLLHPDNATIMWKLPRNAAGEVDYDVTYDIWLLTKPDDLTDQNKLKTPLVQNVKLSDLIVKSDGEEVGAKYTLTNLIPNSTYYFRVVANKTFVVYTDGDVQYLPLSSQPSVKLVITPPRENGDTPVAPAAPPLSIKLDADKNQIVSDTTATITIKNKWYEMYVNGKWEYKTEYTDSQGNTVQITDETVANDKYGEKFRIVEYDGGVSFYVGALKVSDLPENFTADQLNDIEITDPAYIIKGYSINDGKIYSDHNLDIELTGLDPNTNYIIWAKAVRTATAAVSDASDALYITTDPSGTDIPVKPTVPNFNYGYAGDTYVMLGWDYSEGNPNFVYNIKYSTREDVETAEGSVTVSYSDIVNQKLITISKLEQSTDYYFWIQAEYKSNGTTVDSDFGDAYHLKTTEFAPPDTPYGFGIKGGSDTVTKSSITYEWMTVTGLEYILEIADNVNYSNSTVLEVGTVSEYKVEGLKSNTRYYARLYAYNSTTKLKSQPTQSVIAKTLKSKDDYDSDEDTDTVISGDFIVKDDYASSQTWKVSIVGVNADRFIESIRNGKQLEYIMDLTNPPSDIISTEITMSGKIFTELSNLGRTLTFKTKDYSISFGPGTLDEEASDYNVYTNYIIILSSGVSDSKVKPDKLQVMSKIGRVEVKRQEGTGYSYVKEFGQAALVNYNLTDSTWYDESDTAGYVLNDSKWDKTESQYKEDSLRGKDYLAFYAEKPCDFVVAKHTSAPYTDVLGSWASDYIIKLSGKVNLKSVQGSLFRPDAYATVSDTVKLVFDVTGYNYSSNFLQEAYRAGLIDKSDALAPNSYCSTEKAIYMLMVMYEKKSGETLNSSGSADGIFQDMGSVSAKYSTKVYFAVENGIYSDNSKGYLKPTGNITRADLAAILVKYLEFIGEL